MAVEMGEGWDGRSWMWAAVKHILVLRIDVGAPGEQLVDEAELAITRGNVEGGPAILRWGTEGRRRGGRKKSGSGEGGDDLVRWRKGRQRYSCMVADAHRGRCGVGRRVRVAGGGAGRGEGIEEENILSSSVTGGGMVGGGWRGEVAQAMERGEGWMGEWGKEACGNMERGVELQSHVAEVSAVQRGMRTE